MEDDDSFPEQSAPPTKKKQADYNPEYNDTVKPYGPVKTILQQIAQLEREIAMIGKQLKDSYLFDDKTISGPRKRYLYKWLLNNRIILTDPEQFFRKTIRANNKSKNQKPGQLIAKAETPVRVDQIRKEFTEKILPFLKQQRDELIAARNKMPVEQLNAPYRPLQSYEEYVQGSAVPMQSQKEVEAIAWTESFLRDVNLEKIAKYAQKTTILLEDPLFEEFQRDLDDQAKFIANTSAYVRRTKSYIIQNLMRNRAWDYIEKKKNNDSFSYPFVIIFSELRKIEEKRFFE